jgi:hypothetical protein
MMIPTMSVSQVEISDVIITWSVWIAYENCNTVWFFAHLDTARCRCTLTSFSLWWTSSVFVISVPIQNSIWLPEPVMQIDWLSLKALLITNYIVVWNLIWCKWFWSVFIQSCDFYTNPRWPPLDPMGKWIKKNLWITSNVPYLDI